jgi:PncC family amidohydrolase
MPGDGLRARFGMAAEATASAIASPSAFFAALACVVVWAAAGPLFGFSDTWQLVINTGTTIVTFLIVFLIQNTQNRDTRIINLKLDELLRALSEARTEFVALNELTDTELQDVETQFRNISDRVGSLVNDDLDLVKRELARRRKESDRARENDDDLDVVASRLVKKALEKDLPLAAAESCTGGALAQALTRAPKASTIVKGGFVVYTKAAKSAVLGVPQDILAKETAVAASVARAMALGALRRSEAGVAMAVTGVAGPAPDEDGNPVGLVFVAAAQRDGRFLGAELRLEGDAQAICNAAMIRVMLLAEKLLD